MSSVEPFDINDYLRENEINKSYENKNVTNSFEDVWKSVREYFSNIYDSDRISPEKKEERQEIEHKAIQGNFESEQILTNEIETYLRERNLLGTDYPKYYSGLANGCFQEIYRFGAFYKWNHYPHSPSAIIQGSEQWYKIDGQFVRQDESLRDEKHIEEIIRALQVYNPGLIINESNPYEEFDMEDGTRVTVVVPPRALVPTIVFRRFIIDDFSLNEQARQGTIEYNDVPLVKALSKAHLNTIIAGPPESGKSTFLKTMYSERDPRKVAVLIETSRESYLKYAFPNRLVHDFYTTDGDIHKVIRSALKVDHDYIIVQEVRGIEAEGAISGTERGTRGLLMTYHITDPENTPIQLARHITDHFPSRRETNEVRRIAKQLDLGFTMNTFKGNKKRITSIYELCYEEDKDEAWINYLMKYDKKTDSWRYNANVSQSLIDRIANYDEGLKDEIIKHLEEKASLHPIVEQTKYPCLFKEE